MFMRDHSNEHCGVYCSCGCGSGIVLKAEKDGDYGYFLSLVSDKWYTSSTTAWERFKEKCKRIWCIIRNKEYYYFDICVRKKDLEEFKEFVAKME